MVILTQTLRQTSSFFGVPKSPPFVHMKSLRTEPIPDNKRTLSLAEIDAKSELAYLNNLAEIARYFPKSEAFYSKEAVFTYLDEISSYLIKAINSGIFPEGGNTILLEIIEQALSALPFISDEFWSDFSKEEIEQLQKQLSSLLVILCYAGALYPPSESRPRTHPSAIILSYWIYALMDKLARNIADNKLKNFSSHYLSLLFALKEPTFVVLSSALNRKLSDALTHFDAGYRQNEPNLLEKAIQNTQDKDSAITTYKESLIQLFGDTQALHIAHNHPYKIEKEDCFVSYCRQFSDLDSFEKDLIPLSANILMHSAWMCSLMATNGVKINRKVFDSLATDEFLYLFDYSLKCEADSSFTFRLWVNNYDYVACFKAPSNLVKFLSKLKPQSYFESFGIYASFVRDLSENQKLEIANFINVKNHRELNFDIPSYGSYFGLDSKKSVELISIGINPYTEISEMLRFARLHKDYLLNKGLQYLIFAHLFSPNALELYANNTACHAEELLTFFIEIISYLAENKKEDNQHINSCLFFILLYLQTIKYIRAPSNALGSLMDILKKDILPSAKTAKELTYCHTVVVSLYATLLPDPPTIEDDLLISSMVMEKYSNCFYPFIPDFNIQQTLSYKSMLKKRLPGFIPQGINDLFNKAKEVIEKEQMPKTKTQKNFEDILVKFQTDTHSSVIEEHSSSLPVFLNQRQSWNMVEFFADGWDETYTLFRRASFHFKKTLNNIHDNNIFYKRLLTQYKLLSSEEKSMIVGAFAVMALKISMLIVPLVLINGAIFFLWHYFEQYNSQTLKVFETTAPEGAPIPILYTENSLNPHAGNVTRYRHRAVMLIRSAKNNMKAILLEDFETAQFTSWLKKAISTKTEDVKKNAKEIAIYDLQTGNQLAVCAEGFNKTEAEKIAKFDTILKACQEAAQEAI